MQARAMAEMMASRNPQRGVMSLLSCNPPVWERVTSAMPARATVMMAHPCGVSCVYRLRLSCRFCRATNIMSHPLDMMVASAVSTKCVAAMKNSGWNPLKMASSPGSVNMLRQLSAQRVLCLRRLGFMSGIVVSQTSMLIPAAQNVNVNGSVVFPKVATVSGHHEERTMDVVIHSAACVLGLVGMCGGWCGWSLFVGVWQCGTVGSRDG